MSLVAPDQNPTGASAADDIPEGQTDARYEAAERLAGLGSCSWTLGSRSLTCSAGMRRLIGAVSPSELTTRQALRRIVASDRSSVISALRQAMAGEPDAAVEFCVAQSGRPPLILRAAVCRGDGPDGPLLRAVCQDVTETRRVQAALDGSERRWELALETARQGVWDANLETGRVYHSRTWRALRGMDPGGEDSDTHEEWQLRVHPDDRDDILAKIRQQACGQPAQIRLEYRERHRDGHYIWISSVGTIVEWSPSGRARRVIGTDTDVTERKQREAEMTRLSQRLRLALAVSRIGIFEADLDNGRLFWDRRVREIYGAPLDDTEMPVDYWEKSLHPADAEGARRAVQDAVDTRSQYDSEFRIIRGDGNVRIVRTHGVHYVDGEGRPKMLGVNWDVTEEVAAQRDLERAKSETEAHNIELEAARARIEHDSLHDTLTGLPNRRYLDEILVRHARASTAGAGAISLLHIDLDRFKQINDTLGHAAGDAMLNHVAGLLRAHLGTGDFVARVGGDEFVVVCRPGSDTKRVTSLAASIIERIRQPVPYEGHLCRFGASIGIATQQSDTVDPKLLLIDADIALYRAKGHGKNRYEIFSEDLQAQAVNTKRIADDILRAIEQQEFVPYYQPVVDACSFAVVGVEALARWQHPQRGILPPSAFLRIAEDLSVVTAIDHMILDHALDDFRRWSAAGLPVQTVAVNVSFRRLHDPQLVDRLRRLSIRPGTISFELLESIFLDEPDETVLANLEQIRGLGIDIDIDDFGTGHASIISLLKLKPRRLKIDREFITEVVASPAQRHLVGSLIEMGKSLGIQVVAEGVETREQAIILRNLGCDLMQGYVFGRPLPASQLEAALRPPRRRIAS